MSSDCFWCKLVIQLDKVSIVNHLTNCLQRQVDNTLDIKKTTKGTFTICTPPSKSSEAWAWFHSFWNDAMVVLSRYGGFVNVWKRYVHPFCLDVCRTVISCLIPCGGSSVSLVNQGLSRTYTPPHGLNRVWTEQSHRAKAQNDQFRKVVTIFPRFVCRSGENGMGVGMQPHTSCRGWDFKLR